MSKSIFINKNFNTEIVYQISEQINDSVLKFKFYKAIILFAKLLSGEIDSTVINVDFVRDYLQSLYDSGKYNSKVNIELLLHIRDLIFIRLSAAQKVYHELN